MVDEFLFPVDLFYAENVGTCRSPTASHWFLHLPCDAGRVDVLEHMRCCIIRATNGSTCPKRRPDQWLDVVYCGGWGVMGAAAVQIYTIIMYLGYESALLL